MDTTRKIKFILDVIPSVLHLLIMVVLGFILLSSNTILGSLAFLSAFLLFVSYVWILTEKFRKGKNLLLVMSIVNLPFGILSLVSYFC